MDNSMQYDGILTEAVKAYAGTLVDLYKSGCTDIEMYRMAGELVPVGIPPQKEDDIIGKQLQSEMDNTRMLVTDYKDAPYTRAKAGITYIKSKLYQKIKQSGIGKLLEFSFKGKQLYVKISLNLDIEPVPMESASKRKERMEKAAEESSFIWNERKTYNRMFMKCCTSNLTKIKQWLDSMFCHSGFKADVRGDDIWYISCYVKSFHDFEIQGGNDKTYRINEIVKTAGSMIKDINTITAYPETKDIIYDKLASDCFHICMQTNSDCDFVRQYKKKILPLRDKNMDTQNRIKEIGEKVSFNEIQEIVKPLSDSICEKLEQWYGAYVEFKIDGYGLFGTLHLNSISMQLDETDNFRQTFKLKKLVKEYSYGEYYIPSYEIDEIRDIMILDSLDIKNIKIDYCDGYSCIKEIEFYIHDLWSGKWIMQG